MRHKRYQKQHMRKLSKNSLQTKFRSTRFNVEGKSSNSQCENEIYKHLLHRSFPHGVRLWFIINRLKIKEKVTLVHNKKYKLCATCQTNIVNSLFSRDEHQITLRNYIITLAKGTTQFLGTRNCTVYYLS